MTSPSWRNWSGSETVTPHEIITPSSERDIIACVTRARAEGRRVKAIGSGHSFTGVAVAPDIQVDLSRLSGVVGIDRERGRVTLLSGTKLWQIPAMIRPLGLAMQNLGDINRQSILGAISTSTHGTGLRFGGVASQVVGLRIVTGTGDIMDVTQEDQPDLLDGLRVTLGAFGIVTEVTLQLVGDFDLKVSESLAPWDAAVTDWRDHLERHDHYEFFWFVGEDRVIEKISSRLPQGAEPYSTGHRVSDFVSNELLGNGAFAALCQIGRFVPRSIPLLNRWSTAGWGERTRVKHWSEGFASPRRVRFHEMEYAVPVDAVPDILRELRDLCGRTNRRVTFPIEVRAAAADTGWLATNHGRETGYIAIHQHISESREPYFSEIEPILVRHEGRPHWGKLHTLRTNRLAERYPRWEDALALRERCDPDRLFANPYTDQVFGR